LSSMSLQILKPNASRRFACDGADLHYEIWDPNETARGTIFHSHGVCESNETTNTQRLAQRAVARGWRLIALEHEGHGLSGGARGVVSFERCARLFEAFVETMTGSAGPWALAGHSLGAIVALRAARRLGSADGYVGAVLFGAAVGIDPRSVPPAVVVGALRVASVFFPRASLGATPVEDPDEYALPLESTRNFRGHWPLVTARELLDVTRNSVPEVAGSPRGLDPSRNLFVHGELDLVVPLEVVREYLTAARLPSEALKVVEKGGHDVLGGMAGDEACAFALDWLEERVLPR